MTRRRVVAAGAVLVVAAAVGAELAAPVSEVPVAERVAVAGTELVCPFAPTNDAPAGRSVRSTLSMVSVPDLAAGAQGVGEEGQTQLGRVDDPDSIAGPNSERVFATVAAPATAPYVGTGTGSRAPGLALDSLTVSERRGDHGLAGVTCGPPVNEAWFVGAGSGVGRDARIHLVNPEPTPATVDVSIFGANGTVEAPGARGVEVEARGSTVLSLASVAPGVEDVALNVVAVSGRVGVGVRETEVNGLQPRGADWVPVSEAPADRVVVPGLASGEGARRLSLFAPGTGTATVEVSVVGRQGPFVPTGGGPVDIDRGRVTTIDLGAALSEDEAAVVVDSPVPVIAGVRWQTEGDETDLAFSAGSPALSGASVVPGLRIDGGMTSRLFLTAPDGAATVRVRLLVDGVEQGDPRTVEVAAERTVRVDAAEDGVEGVFAVVVEPVAGAGAVHAAVVRQQRVDGVPSMTVSTLRPTRAVVDVPVARQDLGVATRR